MDLQVKNKGNYFLINHLPKECEAEIWDLLY